MDKGLRVSWNLRMLFSTPRYCRRSASSLIAAGCVFFSGVIVGADSKNQIGLSAEEGSSNDPVELAAQSGLRFEGNIGYAAGPVVLAQGDTRVFAENAEFDRETRDFILTGSVRIYRGNRVFMAERAVYNLESQQLMAGDFRTAAVPLFAEGGGVYGLGTGAI